MIEGMTLLIAPVGIEIVNELQTITLQKSFNRTSRN